jgi:uncharacterized protein YceK
MMKQNKKTTTKLAVVTMMSLALITGCSSLPSSDATKNSQNSTEVESSSKDSSSKDSSQESTDSVPLVVESEAESVTSDQKPSSDTEAVSFQTYFDLLGSGKEDFIKNINEKPDKVDEGGLEFKDLGIRVWFNMEKGTVSQIFSQNTDLDFNGAKIGDKIDDFKTAFGEPVSDQNGDMHFKYENGYISVNYDTQTNNTVAVYLLSEDF